MKKNLLFCFVALFGLLAQPANAYWKKLFYDSDQGKKTGRIQPGEISDGMTIAFEAAVGSYTTGTLSLPRTEGANLILKDLQADIPEESVWVLEAATERDDNGIVTAPNGKTYQLYYMKSKKTGQYIGAATYSGGLIKDDSKLKMVDGTDEAVPVSIMSQNGSGYGGSGQNNTGDKLYDNYSVVIIADISVYKSGGNIRALDCSATKAFESNPEGRIGWAHWSGLRTWDAYAVEEVTGGQAILAALLETYSTNGWTPDKYVGGTTPGCYDPDLAAGFAEAFSDVEAAADNENLSEDDANTLATALNEARTAVETTFIKLTDGYYYIKSAYTDFPSEVFMVGTSSLSDVDAIQWAEYDQWNAAGVFKITATGKTDQYNIQNLLTEYYINVPGTYEPQTVTATTPQTITAGSVGGQFYIANTTKTGAYTASDTEEESGAIVSGSTGAANSPSAWTLVPIDESMVESLIEDSKQSRLNIKLAQLIEDAQAEYDATAVVTKIDEDSPLVTDAAQFTTNAPEPKDDCGVENAIDNDLTTYFHTRWSGKSGATEPHYLCAYFKDGVSNFAFKFQRRANNTNNYPLEAVLLVSNDSATWTTVDTLSIPMQQSYTSPVYNFDQMYKYVKYSVIRTSNGQASNGEKAFSYAEFNYYPATADENRSASVRADLQPALATFKAAIDKASAVENATQDDIDALQAALDAYVAFYPDVTLVENAISDLQTYIASQPVQDGTIGYYPSSAVSETNDAIDALGSTETFAAMTRAQINETVEKVAALKSAFDGQLNVGDPNTLYRINGATGRGIWYVSPSGSNPGNLIYCETASSVGDLQGSYWQIRRASDSTVYLQSAATGLYIRPGRESTNKTSYLNATPYEYRVFTLGKGYLYFVEPGQSSGCLYAELTSNGTYLTNNISAASLGNHNGWLLEAVENPVMTTTMKSNAIRVLTLPFTTKGLPTTDGVISCYKLIGAETEGDSVVVNVKLGLITEDEAIPAGTPVIVETGTYSLYDASADEVTLNLNIDLDNITLTSTTAGAQNGLNGVLYRSTLSKAGCGYFSAGQLLPVESGSSVTLGRQTGYIEAGAIKDLTDGYDEGDILTVEVDGSINITAIKNAIANANGTVNVYTLDGVLVKKNVKASDATQGLQKGIYVVGKKKVLVK